MRIQQRAGVFAAALALVCGAGTSAAAHRNDSVYQAAVAHRAAALALLGEIVDIDSGTGDVEIGRAHV